MSTPSESTKCDRNKIMLIGGYGRVGELITARLAPRYPDRLIIAGRNLDKAKACAARIEHGAVGQAVDISSSVAGSALDKVALVLVCLDQENSRFVECCLAHGINYLDISADYEFLRQVSDLDGLAKRHGATAVLSVGVAPGLTNLLAARAKSAMDRTDRLDIFVQIGLGDRHGDAAIGWMLDNLNAAYRVCEAGRTLSVRSFGESQRTYFSGRRQERTVYRFNFSDQHVLPHTLNVPSVSTWLCFDSRISTWLFAVSVRAGLGRVMRNARWRAAMVWLFKNVHIGSDICAVSVRAMGKCKNGNRALQLGIVGRNEALMTAVAAAETARQVLSGASGSGGVFHSEQIIELDPVVSALKEELPDLLVTSGYSQLAPSRGGPPPFTESQQAAL